MSKAYPPVQPPFRANVSAKPFSVDALGTVTFIDRLDNEVTPNESLCTAYGYKFDIATNTCKAFYPTTSIDSSLRTEDNTVSGQGNIIGEGTTNSYIMGAENTIEGNSRNNIIVGNNNNIVDSIDNANVYGTLGEATANNSIVLGGNAAGDNLGERQTMTIMYGKQTTNNSTVDAFLNNTTDSYFVVPTNTVIYFQSETLAVRVGGSSGSGAVGDYKSWVERGVVKNAAGTLSIDRSRTSPADSGTTTGWSPINSVSGTNFLQTVKGATDMTIEWASTIRITQIKTGVTLS
tara:strand:- start:146 stop:1018 length:873 start_codon:yes stop_codon:yes gene_type:complete